jgi:hypothetical protein
MKGPTLFLGGSLAGAMAAGSMLWIASGLLRPIHPTGRLFVLGAVGVLVLLRDSKILHLHLPENRRQVPQSIFARGPGWAAAQFGFEMGTGARTYVTATSPYLLASFILLLAPNFSQTLAAASGFGIARGILPMTRWLSQDAAAWDEMNDRWAPRIPLVTAVICCGAAILLATALV